MRKKIQKLMQVLTFNLNLNKNYDKYFFAKKKVEKSKKSSSVILIKTQLNECFLRKLLDLIPGFNEFTLLVPNSKCIKFNF